MIIDDQQVKNLIQTLGQTIETVESKKGSWTDTWKLREARDYWAFQLQMQTARRIATEIVEWAEEVHTGKFCLGEKEFKGDDAIDQIESSFLCRIAGGVMSDEGQESFIEEMKKRAI